MSFDYERLSKELLETELNRVTASMTELEAKRLRLIEAISAIAIREITQAE